MRKLVIVLIILGVLLLIGAMVFVFWLFPAKIRPLQEYYRAVSLYEKGDYVPAALQFESMKSVSGASEYAKRAWIAAGDAAFETGDLAQARTYYLKGGASSDIFEKVDSAYYQNGVKAYAENDRIEGENCFSCISQGSRYRELLDAVRISCAERYINDGDYTSAEKVLDHCGRASLEEISEIWFEQGEERLRLFDLDNASYCFAKAMAASSDKDALIQKADDLWNAAGEAARREGNYTLAEKCFARTSSGAEGTSAQMTAYSEAVKAYGEGRFIDALRLFSEAEGFRDSDDQADNIRKKLKHYFAAGGAGYYATLGPDGKVELGGDWGTYQTPEWSSIRAIACGLNRFMLGLRENGTVTFMGNSSFGNSEVTSWQGIVAIACGSTHSLGLRSTGSIASCGLDSYGEVSGTYGWKNITAIAAGDGFTVAIKNDGTVLACGNDAGGRLEVGEWQLITAIACGSAHTVGLKNDGTVVACGENPDGRCDVSGWTDIAAIFAGGSHTVGLKKDGTLVACGSNTYGECNVSSCSNVLSVACGEGYTLVLFNDGTTVKLGDID